MVIFLEDLFKLLVYRKLIKGGFMKKDENKMGKQSIKFETGIYFVPLLDLKTIELFCGQSKIHFYCCGTKVDGFSTREGEIYEIHIITYDIVIAQYLLNLITSSKAVIDSSLFSDLNTFNSNLQCSLDKALGKKSDMFIEAHKCTVCEVGNEWYYACIMASKAFDECYKENAIFKFQLAREICDLHPMDLHPNFNVILSPFPYDHLKYAYAIVIAYSILEELGLEIRTSNQSSTIDDGKKWNPIVHENLRKRLVEKNIDPKLELPWIVREKIIRPYKKNIDTTKVCEWSNGEEIRDFYINIMDAILELSYIRSKISSHGVGERVSELNICDVENAYCLVRIILLNYFQINLSNN